MVIKLPVGPGGREGFLPRGDKGERLLIRMAAANEAKTARTSPSRPSSEGHSANNHNHKNGRNKTSV